MCLSFIILFSYKVVFTIFCYLIYIWHKKRRSNVLNRCWRHFWNGEISLIGLAWKYCDYYRQYNERNYANDERCDKEAIWERSIVLEEIVIINEISEEVTDDREEVGYGWSVYEDLYESDWWSWREILPYHWNQSDISDHKAASTRDTFGECCVSVSILCIFLDEDEQADGREYDNGQKDADHIDNRILKYRDFHVDKLPLFYTEYLSLHSL